MHEVTGRSEWSGVTLSSGFPLITRIPSACPRPERSERLPALLGLEHDADKIFSRLKVAVIGVGSVGRSLALHLSRLMIHTLWLVDPGRYKASSLLTQQVLPVEVGQAKAPSTAQVCKDISPETRVFAATGRIEDLDQLALADADFVFLATDNLAAEMAAGQLCLNLGLPLLQASVHGASLLAQVRFFTNRDGQGPCPACGYGDQEWDALNRQTRFSCEGGQPDTGATNAGTMQIESPATASFSFLCSLAADLAMIQLTRYVLKLGDATGDSLTEYCGYNHQAIASPLPRHFDCRCEHVVWRRMAPPRALGDCTLSELVCTAGFAESSAANQTALMVDEWEFIETGLCTSCGQRQTVGRFQRPASAAGDCRKCGQTVTALPFYSQRQVPLTVLAAQCQHPLRRLTPTNPRWVVLQAGDQAVCFRQGRTSWTDLESTAGPSSAADGGSAVGSTSSIGPVSSVGPVPAAKEQA
jgi:molybdopterin/thiamine biosynthesis adenylyltransferase